MPGPPARRATLLMAAALVATGTLAYAFATRTPGDGPDGADASPLEADGQRGAEAQPEPAACLWLDVRAPDALALALALGCALDGDHDDAPPVGGRELPRDEAEEKEDRGAEGATEDGRGGDVDGEETDGRGKVGAGRDAETDTPTDPPPDTGTEADPDADAPSRPSRVPTPSDGFPPSPAARVPPTLPHSDSDDGAGASPRDDVDPDADGDEGEDGEDDGDDDGAAARSPASRGRPPWADTLYDVFAPLLSPPRATTSAPGTLPGAPSPHARCATACDPLDLGGSAAHHRDPDRAGTLPPRVGLLARALDVVDAYVRLRN